MRRPGVLVFWIVAAMAAIGCDGRLGGDEVDSNPGAWGAPTDASAPPAAADLLGKLATCARLGGDFASDAGATESIPICGLSSAVFWKADLDVDCDGKPTPACNSTTDPAYQAQTSAKDSRGNPLDAAMLPYVVVPLPGKRFDYAAAGLELGTVVAVIYQDKIEYGVLGDEGPANLIGEASYAMAAALGIDPDPATGGADRDVTYVAFTGHAALVTPIEDHDAARELGIAKARALLSSP